MKQSIITCILLILFFSGCVFPGGDWDFNPIFRTEDHKSRGAQDQAVGLPFFESRQEKELSKWTLRPLITCASDRSKQKVEGYFIPPFGHYKSDPNKTKIRFWPIYSYQKTSHFGTEDDVDWVLFPLLFGGHSDSGEDYFAIFPLGGHIRNFLSFDSFTFVLWPLFQQVTKASTNSTSTSFLWLYAYTEDGPRDGSFQILPFYMHRTWKERYDRYSVLWPFFHYQENKKDTDHPTRKYALWPLFLHESSDNYHKFGLLGPLLFMGPFIQTCRETPDQWQGEPNTEGHSYYLYDLPWPILHMEKNREFERFRILPFYSHYQAPGFDSKAYLIPFFWLRKEENKNYRKTNFFFVPLFHYRHKEYVNGLGEDLYYQLWPLFHNSSYATGEKDFSMLSPIPYRTKEWLAAVDEVLWPFWNIYRYREDAAGAGRHSALFGLFSYYKDPFESRFSVPIIYNNKYSQEDRWEHSLLLNMFSWGGDGNGLNKLRLFFIPFIDS